MRVERKICGTKGFHPRARVRVCVQAGISALLIAMIRNQWAAATQLLLDGADINLQDNVWWLCCVGFIYRYSVRVNVFLL